MRENNAPPKIFQISKARQNAAIPSEPTVVTMSKTERNAYAKKLGY